MANKFYAKPLTDGIVPTAKGSLYTAGADVICAYIKRADFFNSDAAEQTVEIWINFTGTSRPWRRLVLAQYEHAGLLDEGDVMHLGPNDILEAKTTSGANVHFLVTGIEEKAT